MLIRIATRAGHGGGKPTSKRIDRDRRRVGVSGEEPGDEAAQGGLYAVTALSQG